MGSLAKNWGRDRRNCAHCVLRGQVSRRDGRDAVGESLDIDG